VLYYIIEKRFDDFAEVGKGINDNLRPARQQ
jgi:hypothetical protein